MIKRYNQFVNERVNEEFEGEFPDTNQQESELAARELEGELDEFEGEVSDNLDMEEEEQMEEEGGDLYQRKLQELANILGTEVEDGKLMYDGKKIIFPSETEMYHVGNKKFKTADEVVNFLEGGSNEIKADEPAVEPEMNLEEEPELELQESKSYRNSRKFNKRKK